MKHLFTLCLFTLFSINTFGQSIIKDSISQKYEAREIIKIDSLKADVIFTKAKEWITLNYKSANDVIQLADKESLKIIATHATSNLGIWLNLKIGFVFGRFGKSERMGLI
jgi:hypothetical protein